MTIGRFFLAASLALLVFFGNIRTVHDTLNRLETFDYFFAPLLILYLVSVLERILDRLGVISSIESYLADRNLTRLSYAFIPGLIGLIPSIGGAHFACSMFPSSAGKELSGCQLAAINYFFRHFHVYSNPLITGTVLACAITNTSLWFVSLTLLPLTLLTFLLGWKFLIPSSKKYPKETGFSIKSSISLKMILLFVSISIETLIFFLLDIKICFWLAVVIFTLALVSPQTVWEAFKPSKDNLFLLSEVAFILIFACVINSLGINQLLTNFIYSSGVPTILAFSLVTVFLAYITGISQAYVAIVMPLIAGLTGNQFSLVCWLLALGFFIQYLTPAHLCLIVCAKYFKCSAFRLIQQIFPPVALAFLLWSLGFLAFCLF